MSISITRGFILWDDDRIGHWCYPETTMEKPANRRRMLEMYSKFRQSGSIKWIRWMARLFSLGVCVWTRVTLKDKRTLARLMPSVKQSCASARRGPEERSRKNKGQR
jgi:hypothetical protein